MIIFKKTVTWISLVGNKVIVPKQLKKIYFYLEKMDVCRGETYFQAYEIFYFGTEDLHDLFSGIVYIIWIYMLWDKR